MRARKACGIHVQGYHCCCKEDQDYLDKLDRQVDVATFMARNHRGGRYAEGVRARAGLVQPDEPSGLGGQ